MMYFFIRSAAGIAKFELNRDSNVTAENSKKSIKNRILEKEENQQMARLVRKHEQIIKARLRDSPANISSNVKR